MRALLLCMMILAGACTAPGQKHDESRIDIDRPKYGVDDYQTVWDTGSPEKRDRLKVQSRDAAARGWEMLRVGDSATALRRFNQAWTLYPHNAQAVWGMAIISFKRAKAADRAADEEGAREELYRAVELIEEAVSYVPHQPSLLTDAALIHATRGGYRRHLNKANAEADFQRAEALLRKAIRIEQHPHIYETWAVLERYRGREGRATEFKRKAAKMADDGEAPSE